MTRIDFVLGRPQAQPSVPAALTGAMDDDSHFLVGGLRCKSQAAWLVRIGAGQLRKSSRATVKIRVGEDREQAVRRFVHEKKHTAAAALIDSAHGARPLSTRIHALFLRLSFRERARFWVRLAWWGWLGGGGRSWARVAASGDRTGLSERCPGA